MNRPGFQVAVFVFCSMFSDVLQFIGKRDLLNYMPLFQWLEAKAITCTEFVFDHLINFFRPEGRSAELTVTSFAASLSFISPVFNKLSFGFDNVT